MNYFKLMKYELKGRYKGLLLFVVLILAWYAFLYTRVGVWEKALPFVLSTFTMVGVMFYVFIYGVWIFNKELNDDTAYLLYTLPVSGYEITGAKLTIAFLLFLIFFIVNSLGSIFILDVSMRSQMINMSVNFPNTGFLYRILLQEIGFDIFIVIMSILTLLGTWLTLYVSIILSRMIMYKRRFGMLLSAGIFVGATILIGKIRNMLEVVFPQTIQFKLALDQTMSNPNGPGPIVPINIAGTVFTVLLSVGLFVLVSELIQRRLEI